MDGSAYQSIVKTLSVRIQQAEGSLNTRMRLFEHRGSCDKPTQLSSFNLQYSIRCSESRGIFFKKLASMLSNAYLWLKSSRFKIFGICGETSSPTSCRKLPRNSTRISKNDSKEDSFNFSILVLLELHKTYYAKGNLLGVIDIEFSACRHQSKNSRRKPLLQPVPVSPSTHSLDEQLIHFLVLVGFLS